MLTREQEAGGEAEGRSGPGWKGPRGKRAGWSGEAGARVVGEVRAASAKTLWDPPGRTRGSGGETAPQSVGWRGAAETRSGSNSGRRPDKGSRRPAGARERQVGKLETGAARPLARGPGRARPGEAGGGAWRASPQGGQECVKSPWQSWRRQSGGTRGLIGKFREGMDCGSDTPARKFRILEYLFAFLQTRKEQ